MTIPSGVQRRHQKLREPVSLLFRPPTQTVEPIVHFRPVERLILWRQPPELQTISLVFIKTPLNTQHTVLLDSRIKTFDSWIKHYSYPSSVMLREVYDLLSSYSSRREDLSTEYLILGRAVWCSGDATDHLKLSCILAISASNFGWAVVILTLTHSLRASTCIIPWNKSLLPPSKSFVDDLFVWIALLIMSLFVLRPDDHSIPFYDM